MINNIHLFVIKRNSFILCQSKINSLFSKHLHYALAESVQGLSLSGLLAWQSDLGVGSLWTWGLSEVFQGFSMLRASQKESIGASWCSLSEFVEGKAFSSSGQDSLLCGFSKLQGTDSHLWDNQHSLVVGNCANANGCDSFFSCKILGDSGYGDWVSVHSGLFKSLKNDLIEFWVGSSCQESVQLYWI